jgi:plasmid replication initiation protein
MGHLQEQKQKEVKKHVAIIHCVNTLSLLQRKISNALLYYAYPHLYEREEHEISVKQLCNIIGYSGHNHKVIKEALKGLISIIIEWDIFDQQTGEEDWTASSILASVRIKGPKCFYAYSPRMRELLYSPVMYGKINLIIQARFNSSYGLALYENCVRYNGLSYTKWFELNTFRKLMGVPENIYVKFRDFKKRVLNKSVEEVNTYSDLIVTPEINRVGRKVISIRFRLKEREKKKKLGISTITEKPSTSVIYNNNERDADLIRQLKEEFKITNDQIGKLLTEYETDFIKEKIHFIKISNSYIAGKIENLSAYLLCALKENYHSPKSIGEAITSQNREKEQQEYAQKVLREKESVLRCQYKEYMTTQFDLEVASLDSLTLNQIQNAFIKSIKEQENVFIYSKIITNGLEEAVVKIFFRNFLREYYPNLVPALLSFDEFVKKEEQVKSEG